MNSKSPSSINRSKKVKSFASSQKNNKDERNTKGYKGPNQKSCCLLLETNILAPE